MFCPKCGNNLPDNATFCNVCGTPMNNNQPMPPQQPQQYYQPPMRSGPKKEFNLGLSSSLTSLILKCISFATLLFAFIYGIVKATASSSALGSLSDYASSYFGGSSVKLNNGGGFGTFLLYFFGGLAVSAIIYGIGDIIYHLGKKHE